MIASSDVASASTWPKSNEQHEGRHEDQPAADAEQPAERSGKEADHDRNDDLEHQMSSQTPIDREQARERIAESRAGHPLLERGAADRADRRGQPEQRARSAKSTSPRSAYETVPARAISPIEASDVAIGRPLGRSRPRGSAAGRRRSRRRPRRVR